MERAKKRNENQPRKLEPFSGGEGTRRIRLSDRIKRDDYVVRWEN